jgi:hypothetical protein
MPARLILLTLALVLAARPGDATLDEDAVYDLSIAGVPVGAAGLTVSRDGGRYAIDGRADIGFLMFGGEGRARSEGAAAGAGFRPDRYRLAYQGVRRPGRVEIDFRDGEAVRTLREPAPETFDDPGEERAPLEPVHLRDVVDPLAALVVPAAADAGAETVCRGVLPVFSGYVRFDLALSGGAPDPEGGVACGVTYRPVAGHRLDSASVRRMSAPGAVRLSMAPLDDGLWAPRRLALPTRFGTFEMVRRP